MNMLTDQQIETAGTQTKQAIEVIQMVIESIREAKNIPSGHLYAMLMRYMSLDVYEKIINIAINTGLVKKQNHLLIWIG